MGGTTLVLWESKIQYDIAMHSKIISAWYEFTSSLKKFFYPLGYMEQDVMY